MSNVTPNNKTVCFYTIPATGHVNAMWGFMEKLNKEGFKVIAYSTLPFKEKIESSGAIFYEYNLKQDDIDLKDGSRLLKLYSLQLGYTYTMLDKLIEECSNIKPYCIIHDSIAHWGRRVGEVLDIPSVSYCSFVAVNSIFNSSFIKYFSNFFIDTLKDIKVISSVNKYKKGLKDKYNFKDFGFMNTLVNPQNLTIITYSKLLQVGGSGFSNKYFFAGPVSSCFKSQVINDFTLPNKKIIYISLGTILNDKIELFKLLIEELKKPEFHLCISDGAGLLNNMNLDKDFVTIRQNFNQIDLLNKVDAYITGGGTNSLSESISANVPMLMFPQQGEQKIICKKVEQLGFGLISNPNKSILEQVEKVLKLKEYWNYAISKEISTLYLDDAVERIIKYVEDKK